MTPKSIIATVLLQALTMTAAHAQTLDLAALWDFANPALSEERFRAALGKLSNAQGDEALILQTQIARTYGLRKDFVRARQTLAALQPQLAQASAEVQVRHALEWGRSWASAAHAKGSVSTEDAATARQSYRRALDIARSAGLDALAIDAIHMFAFVDTAPADQLRHAQAALAVALSSKQPPAQRWEASIRNNLGVALHGLNRFDEALQQFQQVVLLRERTSSAQAVREARWMVAWTLRAMGRNDEALALQQQLEREGDSAGQPDLYVFEELETLHQLLGQPEQAATYATKLQRLRASTSQ